LKGENIGSHIDVDFHRLKAKTSEELVHQRIHRTNQNKRFEYTLLRGHDLTDVKFYMLRFWYLDGSIKEKESDSNPITI
jgi:type IV secretory pathway component VirB8